MARTIGTAKQNDLEGIYSTETVMSALWASRFLA